MDLIIGTYTEQLPHVHGKADGVLTASFDPASGRIGPVSSLAAARNPSYLATSASGEHVYAVHETLDFDDQPGGGITAYARDPRTGQLTALNARATLGDSPCHVTLDRSGRFVLNANYGVDVGSVTVHRIEPDGRLGDMTDHVEHAGSGPDPVRQANSHVHMIASDPVTGDILVSDLGSDTVFVYALDRDGRLTAEGFREPGGRPRRGAAAPRLPPGRPPPVRRQRARQHRLRAAPRGRPFRADRPGADPQRRRGRRRAEPGGRHPRDAVRPARPGVQPG